MSTALAEDELLAEVRLPLLPADAKFGFNEFSRRAGDFAMAAALVTYRLHGGKMADVRVGVGGAEPRPRRIAEAEAALNGKAPGDAAFRAAAEAAAAGRRSAGGSSDHAPNTAAIWCARWCAARWSIRIDDRAHQRLRHDLGRPRHPAAGRPGAGHRPRPLHRRSAGRALGALRAQLRRRRQNRTRIKAPDGAHGDHRRRSQRREADPADAAQVQLQAGRPADAGRRRGALCRRAGRGRRRGERGRSRRHRRRGRARSSTRHGRSSTRATRSHPARRRSMPRRPATSSSKARSRRRTSTTSGTARHKIVKVDARSRRQNATPMEPRAAHAAYDAATGRVTLTCTTQMPHLMRTAIADVLGMPEADLRVIAPDVGGGFGQKMSLAAEYVAAGLAGAQAQELGGLDRGPAREPDRLVSCARPIRHARRRLRPERQAARADGRHRRQCRRLFLLSQPPAASSR